MRGAGVARFLPLHTANLIPINYSKYASVFAIIPTSHVAALARP